MNLSHAATGLLGVSVLCWVASMLLPDTFGAGWSDEEEARYVQAVGQLHPHEGDSKTAAETAKAAQAEVDEVEANLEASDGRAHWIRRILQFGCVAAGLAGVGCYIASRQSST